MAGFRRGEAVTVFVGEDDALILQFQRYAEVSRVTDAGVYVVVDATMPPRQEFGPLRPTQLTRGWKDANGRWRA